MNPPLRRCNTLVSTWVSLKNVILLPLLIVYASVDQHGSVGLCVKNKVWWEGRKLSGLYISICMYIFSTHGRRRWEKCEARMETKWEKTRHLFCHATNSTIFPKKGNLVLGPASSLYSHRAFFPRVFYSIFLSQFNQSVCDGLAGNL